MWLNGGVYPTQVAEWAGHDMDVLLRIYPKCVVGQDELAKRRISESAASGLIWLRPAGDLGLGTYWAQRSDLHLGASGCIRPQTRRAGNITKGGAFPQVKKA